MRNDAIDDGARRGAGRRPGRGPARDRHLARARRPGRRRHLDRARSRSRRIARSRCSASASGCSRWRPRSGRRSSARPTLVHGEATEVTHDGAGLLEGMPPSFMAARYHSLAVDPATLPPELRVTAMSEVDRVIMGIRHVSLPLEGVQFHPESVLTPQGPHLLANFLRRPARARRRVLDDAHRLVRDRRAGRAGAGRRRDERARPRRARDDRRGRDAVDRTRRTRRDGRGDGRRGDAGPAGGPADGPADARRDRRRAGRVRHGDARAGRRGSTRRTARSTSSGPAATAAARSTSRRRRRWSRPRPACRSPSTATGRSPRGRARPTSSMRSASGSTTTRRRPARRLRELGFAFLFAPNFHPAMRHAGPTRREIGVRTAFNLLGPLTNPAGTTAPAARRRRRGRRGPDGRGRPPLGTERTFVIHGDGVDELPLDGSGVAVHRRRRRGRATRHRCGRARVQARGDVQAGRRLARGERRHDRGGPSRRTGHPARRRAAQCRRGAARRRASSSRWRRGSSGRR